jgi:hypothetical protein
MRKNVRRGGEKNRRSRMKKEERKGEECERE